MIGSGKMKRLWLAGAYAPAVLLIPYLYAALQLRSGGDFDLPSNSLGIPFQVWLLSAIVLCIVWQRRFMMRAPDREQISFHRQLRNNFIVLAIWMVIGHAFLWRWPRNESAAAAYGWLLALIALVPLVSLVRNVQKFNFLQIGKQRNLIYAVFATFLALLYLGLIRRASLWLEPYLPPEATAAILLFLPVVFFEPLQRLMRGILRRTAQTEMDHAQRMMAPIHEVARLGNFGKLTAFIAKWIGDELQLAEVKLSFGSGSRG